MQFRDRVGTNVPRPGDNLPDFRAVQLEFAAHLRHPILNPAPADVEPRRMRIYAELFYNNIERFLANSFPVLRSVLGDARWHARVRDFIHRHASTSPFFQEIPQEFLEFLADRGAALHDPPFLLELAHYEWVELALDLDEDDVPELNIDREGDLLVGRPVVSPLAWSLCYRFPVHRIGPALQPTEAPPEPTFLVVYRNREDRVGFLESNRATARLLEILNGNDALTGAVALASIADELPMVERQTVLAGGRQTLERLRDCDIILGTRND